ncbi:hypothetical protein, partial [Zobellia laminariae]|uniref:hypothetical protein n=1 Tax=Zobellia laminariae TaxID=248906 RepID=UPI004055F71E
MTIKMSKIEKLFIYLSCVLVLATSCKTDTKKESATNAESQNPKIAKLKLQPGFSAEHLYSPGDNNMGSWVSMAFDDKG